MLYRLRRGTVKLLETPGRVLHFQEHRNGRRLSAAFSLRGEARCLRYLVARARTRGRGLPESKTLSRRATIRGEFMVPVHATKRNRAGVSPAAGASPRRSSRARRPHRQPRRLPHYSPVPVHGPQCAQSMGRGLSTSSVVVGQASRLPPGRLAPAFVAGETPAQTVWDGCPTTDAAYCASAGEGILEPSRMYCQTASICFSASPL